MADFLGESRTSSKLFKQPSPKLRPMSSSPQIPNLTSLDPSDQAKIDLLTPPNSNRSSLATEFDSRHDSSHEAVRHQRRSAHNLVERRRRDNINERILDLSHLVPQHRLEDNLLNRRLSNGDTVTASGEREEGPINWGPSAESSDLSVVEKGPNKGDILNATVGWTRDLMWFLQRKLQQESELKSFILWLGGQWPCEQPNEEKRMETEVRRAIELNGPADFFYTRPNGSGLRVPYHTTITGEPLQEQVHLEALSAEDLSLTKSDPPKSLINDEFATKERDLQANFETSKVRSFIRLETEKGRSYNFPFHLCRTWDGMERLIKQSFKNAPNLAASVAALEYDLLDPNGDIILPQVWESVVQPNWTMRVKLWPPPNSSQRENITMVEQESSQRDPTRSYGGVLVPFENSLKLDSAYRSPINIYNTTVVIPSSQAHGLETPELDKALKGAHPMDTEAFKSPIAVDSTAETGMKGEKDEKMEFRRYNAGSIEDEDGENNKSVLNDRKAHVLEAYFQVNPRPDSNVKKSLAIQLDVTLARISNWFQNRRAQAKQLNKQEKAVFLESADNLSKVLSPFLNTTSLVAERSSDNNLFNGQQVRSSANTDAEINVDKGTTNISPKSISDSSELQSQEECADTSGDDADLTAESQVGFLLTKAKQHLVAALMQDVYKMITAEAPGVSQCAGAATPSSSRSPSSTEPGHNASSNQSSLNSKRRRKDGDETPPEEDEAGNNKRRKNDGALGDSGAGNKRFACPFAKHNPRRYKACRNSKGHKTMSHVKQHLKRCHQADILCPICQIRFKDEDDLLVHLRKPRRCELRPLEAVEGMTVRQFQDILIHHGASWKEVYQILFPSATPVPCPYQDFSADVSEPADDRPDQSPQSRALSDYQTYSSERLPATVEANLRPLVTAAMAPIAESLRALLVDVIRMSQSTIHQGWTQQAVETNGPTTHLGTGSFIPDGFNDPSVPNPEDLGSTHQVGSAIGLSDHAAPFPDMASFFQEPPPPPPSQPLPARPDKPTPNHGADSAYGSNDLFPGSDWMQTETDAGGPSQPLFPMDPDGFDFTHVASDEHGHHGV